MAISTAAAIVGASVIGAGSSIISGNKAAKAQKQAAETADATNRYIFDTTREDFRPYREVGTAALGKLAGMYGVGGGAQGMFFEGMDGPKGQPANDNYGGFRESPGYRFRVDEATKAIERSASARGALRSVATIDNLQSRVQDIASSEYENFANRLASLAGIGQSATGSTAAAGQVYAGQQTATNLAAGNARASAYANTGNAINSGVQNLTAAYLYNQGYGTGGYGGGPGYRPGGGF